MKNRKFLLIVSLVLAMTMSLGGTLAYLSDTDADVNVMTLGSVTITQNEQERDADGNLVPFTPNKPAMPAVGPIGWADEGVEVNGTEYKVFTDDLKNVVDKIVTVTNTGKSDAYVRTIVAIEAPDYDPKDLIHINWNGTDCDISAPITAEIGEDDYVAFVFTYKEALGAGETSAPSLVQLFLDSETTNEDVAAFGDTWEVLVLSQAVQADGFADATTALNTAFNDGEEVIADDIVGWFEGWEDWSAETGEIGTPGDKWPNNNPPSEETPVVTNNAELEEAIEAGETEIVMKAGIYHMPAAAKGKTLKLMGTKDTIIEVVPGGQGEAGGQLDYSLDGSTVTFEGLTIKTNSQLYAGFARLSGTYNNCTIQNTYNLGTGNSVFNNCEFNITNEYLRVGGANSAVFNGCTFNTDGRAILVFQDGTNVAQTVTVKDCTFNATAAANTWNGIHVAAVSIDGTNGTYVVNLEGNNVVDSDFNGLWQIKAGEANVTVNE